MNDSNTILLHWQFYYYVLNISGTVSVGGGVGKDCLSESNSLVASVENTVESLKESHAEDELRRYVIWVCDALKLKASNNQINTTLNTTNGCVKGTRPDLSVRSEMECSLIKKRRGE